MTFEIRLPGAQSGLAFDFLDDTGASTVHMYESDLVHLNFAAPLNTLPAPVVQSTETTNAHGTSATFPTRLLEGRVLSPNRMPLTRFMQFYAIIQPHPPSDRPLRLSGLWWRHMLYTASFPTSRGELLVCDNHNEFVSNIPNVNAALAHPPIVMQIPTASG